MPPKTRLVRKPSAGMDAFLKTGNKTGRLLPALERYLQTEPPEDRRQDVLHPSSMAKSEWCPAAGYYQLQRADAGLAGPVERNALQRQNIFDEGHAIHDKWQRRLWRQGVLYGKWRCLLCRHEWWGMSPEFCQALACSALRDLLVYREVPLPSPPQYRIGGHSDGWVKDALGDVMIEIKSVGKGTYRFDAPKMVARYGEDTEALWKNTRRPFSSHLRQLQIYLHLARLEWGEASPSEGVFIYESKMNQMYREFIIAYDPSETAELFEAAADIVERLEAGVRAPDCYRGRDESCPDCRPYWEGK